MLPVREDALRRHALRSAGVTVLSGGIALTVQMVATIVLARLLAPRDFGLVTMVTTFSLLLVNCGLNGMTEAVIQCKNLDRRLASNLFWLNLVVGSLLTVGFCAGGRLLSTFYGEPTVASIAEGISASIFLTSTSVLHLALLKRAMRFSAVSGNDIVAKTTSVAVAILLGCRGWGYWALVLGACVYPLSVSVGAWVLFRWLPSLPSRHQGTGSMAKYAIHAYGRFSLNYLAANVDNLLVGRNFGAHALGFYKKSYDLFGLTASQTVSMTTGVAVSALSRVRDDPEKFKRNLLGALGAMAFLGMGLAADLTLIGKDLIRLLLGLGWDSAGRIFTYFAPGIGVMILYGTHGWIHLSLGRADRWLRWGFVEWMVTIALFLGLLHWGPEGIAAAWCLSFWILFIPAMYYAGKPIELGVWSVLSNIWRYIVASLFGGIGTTWICFHVLSLSSASTAGAAAHRVAFVSIVFLSVYFLAVVTLYGGVSPLRRMVRLLREMVSVVGASETEIASTVER